MWNLCLSHGFLKHWLLQLFPLQSLRFWSSRVSIPGLLSWRIGVTTTPGSFSHGYVNESRNLRTCSCPKLIGSVALTILNGLLTARGTGAQISEDVSLTMRLGFASRELYQICLGTTKLGICAFYLRIFQDRIARVIIRSVMGFVALFTAALSLGIIFQCRPIYGMILNSPADLLLEKRFWRRTRWLEQCASYMWQSGSWHHRVGGRQYPGWYHVNGIRHSTHW